MPLVMDHIIPQAKGGSDERENLAAACYRCNEYKGSKTEGIDPATGMLVPLFNPRSQIWKAHLAQFVLNLENPLLRRGKSFF